LGGYGIIRLIFLIHSSFLRHFIQLFRILGGTLICLVCIQQVDIKILIAYSSVAHIRFVISGIITKTRIGTQGRILILLSHGLVSSGLFLGAYYLYLSSHSRLIFLNQSNLQFIPIFSSM